MVATAKRKAERAKAFAEAQAKAATQKEKNASKPQKSSAKASNQVLTDDANYEHAEVATKPEQKDKKHRFIVFIGNLPYTATTEQIKSHFAAVHPSSIRHSTDKNTGKSKGFAFLEFDDYSHMETCIRTFHHSLFGAKEVEKDDAEAPPDAGARVKGGDRNGRRINVELTAGGGGSKSKARKSKLRAKNEKLSEERRKRATAAEKSSRGPRKVPSAEEQARDAEEESHIHPSRRAKVTM